MTEQERCPKCGAHDDNYAGPRTHYHCGSSRLGDDFDQSVWCENATLLSRVAELEGANIALTERVQRLASEAEQVRGENAKLREVVEKLPVDGDGNPITPGMERWTMDGKHVRIGTVEDDCIGLVHVGYANCQRDGEDEWEEYASELFSTRAAAEAAQQKEGE